MNLCVAVVSDSTGETAESMLHAALSQFSDLGVTIERHRRIREVAQVEELVDTFARRGGQLVVSTLVKRDVQSALLHATEKHHLGYVSMLEPLVSTIALITGLQPIQEPGVIRRLDGDYLRRVKAIEFTLRCDDGQSPELLTDADIVLFGVSRAGKTPLSIWLALKGYAVSNVPLLPGIAPDARVWDVAPQKRVGLLISPERLQAIRCERIISMGLDPQRAAYANIDQIRAELNEARELMVRLGCRIYDSTNQSYEELARNILEDLKLQ
ncbi:MAG: pyruvate, water dikinase regulatory protein [Pyramidobacter sp.]|jgi:regulator of PEP synthase PpsR (kinase-PPPase family)